MNNIDRKTIEELTRILVEDLPEASILRLLQEGNLISQQDEKDRFTNNRQRRLAETLVTICDYSKSPYPVIKLIERANYPGLYALKEDRYLEDRLDKLNEILALEGYLLATDGRISGPRLEEEALSSKIRLEKLREALATRIINQRVQEKLTEDYLLYNYYGLVSSLGADVFAHLRELSQSRLSDHMLIEGLFNQENPVIILRTQEGDNKKAKRDRSTKDLVNDLKQIQKIYRPAAKKEDRRFDFSNRQDAVNILLIISNVHDQLDQAQVLEKLLKADFGLENNV
ncbi:hypothetical protein OZX60_04855 [Streptococcaceae bacterium ESL0687]|nr:hypothetical protein OZX60_04855 [Streptococcaceae bacterium ESL0687]